MTDAPIGRRLLARLLDLAFALVLTFVAVIPVSIVFLVVVAVTSLESDSDAVATVGASACYFIAYVALEWFLLVQRDGQTLGKGLLGLRVINDETDETLTPGPAFGRLFVLFLPFPLLVISDGGNTDTLGATGAIGMAIWAISFVMLFFKKIHRRTLHDMAGGSRVVIAAKRRIDLRKDLTLMVPGKVDMAKRL